MRSIRNTIGRRAERRAIRAVPDARAATDSPDALAPNRLMSLLCSCRDCALGQVIVHAASPGLHALPMVGAAYAGWGRARGEDRASRRRGA